MKRRRGAGLVVLAACVAACGACAEPAVDGTASRLETRSPSGSSNGPVSAMRRIEAALEIYDRGEYDSARVAIEDALGKAIEEGDTAARARALMWLGNAAMNLGDLSEARRLGEESLELKLEARILDELWRSYNALGLVAWWESRFTDAARLFDQGLEAAEAVGAREGIAKILNNRGLVQHDMGEFAEARLGFETLHDLARELGLGKEEAEGLSNLGMTEIAIGRPEAALPVLEEALALFRGNGNAKGEQVTLGHIASAHLLLGDVGKAHEALDEALRISRERGMRLEEAQNLDLLAELYRSAGDRPRALRYFARAKELNRELGDDFFAARDLRSEAVIHASLGDVETARARALEALETHRALGTPLQELADRVILAEVAELSGQPEEASRQLRQVDRIATDLSSPVARGQAALARARVADAARDPRGVLEALRAASSDVVRLGYAGDWEAAALTARAHLRLGDLDEAVSAGRHAVRTVERVRGTLGSDVLRTSLIAARSRTYSDLVTALLRSGDVAGAFEVSDAARGRALAENLFESRESPAIDESARSVADGERILRQIHRLVATLEGRETGELPPPEASAALYERLSDARAAYEDRLVRLADRNPPAARALGVDHIDVVDVRENLQPGEALLEYLVTEDRLLVFVVTPEGVAYGDHPISADNLASRVRIVRDRGSRPDASLADLLEPLTQLHEALIEPATRVAPLSRVNRLFIVPHAALGYLPFGALVDGITGRHLVETYELVHLPSAAVLPLLRARSPDPRLPLEGSGIEVFAPLPEALPATRLEAVAIGGAVGGRVTIGADASERAVRAALDRGRIVHLATHASLVPENPLFSWMEARGRGETGREDGRIEIHELLRLRVASPLVFLSGCETGVGRAWSSRFAQGEDYATLEQALLYSGADRVVATLWRIEDSGAAEFAVRFYEALAADGGTGAGPVRFSRALAAAQRSMLAEPRYGSPFYWAGYRLSGAP